MSPLRNLLARVGLARPTSTDEEDHPEGMGARDIGLIGSLCLVCNNIIGPGMFQLPGLFQTAGWFPSMAAIIVAAVWTTQSALYLSRTMQQFPGNRTFKNRLEFNKIAYILLPKWAYYSAMAVLCMVLFSQNVANIVMVAQVMDQTILSIAKQVCALELSKFTGVCIGDASASEGSDSLFGSSIVFSSGYLVVLLVSIPLGIMNLDDNIGIQIGGMVLTLMCIIVWMANFIWMGLDPESMPMFGQGAVSYAPLLSTVLFNYGFVATIPSWLNEKSSRVPVTSVMCWANFAATAQYVVTALFSALAIANQGNTDLLSLINNGGIRGIWDASTVMTFIFPLANVLTSIPVFSIIMRYNILQLHGVKVPVWVANLLAVVLPWAVAIPFYTGDNLNLVITWSSAILFVLLNLIFPLWMYLSMQKKLEKGEQFDMQDEAHPDQVHLHQHGKHHRASLILDVEAGKLPVPSLNGPVVIGPGVELVKGGANAIIESNTSKEQAQRLLEHDEHGDDCSSVSSDDNAVLDDVQALPAVITGRVEKAEQHYGRGLYLISFILAFAAFGTQVWQQVAPNG